MNKRIRKLRKLLDLTQQDFGKRIGVKSNTISQYETGRNAPVDSVIALICREFNVNENWLRTGKGDMFVKHTRNEQIAQFVEKMDLEDNYFKKRFIATLIEMNETEWKALESIVLKLQNESPLQTPTEPVASIDREHIKKLINEEIKDEYIKKLITEELEDEYIKKVLEKPLDTGQSASSTTKRKANN